MVKIFIPEGEVEKIVIVDGLLRGHEDALDLQLRVFAAVQSGQARGLGFEQDAHAESRAGVVAVEIRNETALFGELLQQAFGHQTVEGNGHRRAAHAEMLGQVTLQKKITGLILELDIPDDEPVGFLLGIFFSIHGVLLLRFRRIPYPSVRNL